MNEHIVDRVSVLAQLDGLQQESVAHKSLLHVLAEEHLLAVTQMNCALGTELAVADVVVYAVVEYHAVLKHLYNRSATVTGGGHHHLLGDGQVDIDRTAEEVATGAKHEFGRDKRILGSAVGR